MEILAYTNWIDKRDIPDSYTQAIKGEHGSKEDRRTNSHISHVFIITYKAHISSLVHEHR